MGYACTPVDHGFTATYRDTRMREWEGHGCTIACELLDEGTGEWAVSLRGPDGSRDYVEAWTESEAMRQATNMARTVSRDSAPDGFDWELPGGVR